MSEEDRKLFVGKLPNDIHEDEIRMVFNTYGRVTDAHIMDGSRQRPGQEPQRCAFVTYETAEAARVAIQVLNDVYRFREDAPEPINVSIARPRGSGGAGKGSNGKAGPCGWSNGPSHDRGSSRGYDDKGGKGGYDRGFGGRDDRGSYERFRSPIPDRGGGMGPVRGGYDRGGDRDRGYDRGGSGYSRNGGRDDRGMGYERGYDRAPERGYDRGGDRGGNHDRGYDRPRDDMDGKGRGKDGSNHPPGTKLYVGNLPPDISREALDMVFSTYGRLVDIHIMTGRQSKNGQACAFIVYSSTSETRTAISAMQVGYEIRPGEGNLIVKYADDKGVGRGNDRYKPY